MAKCRFHAVAQTFLSVLFIFCTYVILTLLLSIQTPNALLAQAPDTLRIPFNRTEITQSHSRLWQNALYRWTVQGRAQVGVFSGAGMVADARFFTTNLGIPQLSQGPTRIPLDENMSVGALCTSLQATPAASPCNTFFATNARFAAPNLPLQQDASFRPMNAVELKPFAFRADNDAFQENARYQATVRGGGDLARAIFVDGLGFVGNQNYRDNPADTALVLVSERLSPELLILAESDFNATNRVPMRVLNDNVPTRILRDTVLNFGSFLAVNPQVQTRRIVLKNRGIEPLRILRIEVVAPQNPVFTVTSSFGRLDNEVVLGQTATQAGIKQAADSLILTLTFTPREAREYAQEIRVVTNDPTNSPWTLRLQGTGALGSLVPIDTLRFGDVRISSAPAQSFTLLRSAFDQTFSIDSIQQPTQPFTVFNLASQEVPVGSNLMQTGFVTFRPNVIGEYRDSIVLRGRNLVDYKIYMTGRGIQAAATIQRQAFPRNLDTLNFGALVTGTSTTQTITVRNTGNLPLNIALSLQASRNGRPSDASEFTIENPQPTALSGITGSQQTYTLRYTATQQIPAGRKEAIWNVRISDQITGAEVLNRPFVVIAERLPNVITPSRTAIDFGEVYIGASSRELVSVSNASQTLAGTLTRQTPVNMPFTAVMLPQPRTFAVGTALPLELSFQPMVLGNASGELTLESRIDSNAATETSRITLRGTGVQQRFELLRVTSDSLFPNNTNTLQPASRLTNGTRVYTADIGCVRLGERKDVRLVFQNNGNIPFGAWNQFSRLEPAQTRDFTIVQQFQQQRRIAPNALDTSLVIRFAPSIVDEQQIEYTLQSDIKRNIGGVVRVPTAPDSTDQIIIILRAQGIVPTVSAPPTVEFDDITVGSTCANFSLRRIAVQNPARSDCGTFARITNARIASGGEAFQILGGQAGFTVRPSTSATIDVEFTSTTLGESRGELVLTTDAPPPRDVLRIGLVGRAISLPNIRMSITTSNSAPPGKVVDIPVIVQASTRGTQNVNAQALTLVERASFKVSYDATLLAFADAVITDGTASAGANVTARAHYQGSRQTLDVSIAAQQGARLLAGETLVILRFNTYLGRDTATDLALSAIRFGDEACQRINIAANEVVNGRFRLDSVCNLREKVRTMTQIPNVVAELAPNPVVSGQTSLNVLLQEDSFLTITLTDAYGTPQRLIKQGTAQAGLHFERIPLADLPTGTYFCEIRAQSTTTGRVQRDVQKIMLLR